MEPRERIQNPGDFVWKGFGPKREEPKASPAPGAAAVALVAVVMSPLARRSLEKALVPPWFPSSVYVLHRWAFVLSQIRELVAAGPNCARIFTEEVIMPF